MVKEIIYDIPSMYRDDFRVPGYVFGKGEKTLCIVGSLRGNEYQQIYICSQLIKRLKELEEKGCFLEGKQVMILPSLNSYSMNIGKRFWPTDNTDINRMFPGYGLGETTQRIADGIFKEVTQYENGIQLASFYMPGTFCSHVRIMKTGFENTVDAKDFGLPYIVLKIPKPYDTTTLNYNWQIWETNAYSLYSSTTATLDDQSKDEIILAIERFMVKRGILDAEKLSDSAVFEHKDFSRIFYDRELMSVRPQCSGIFKSIVNVGQNVKKGSEIATIIDTHEGQIIETLYATVSGKIFFQHDEPLVYANTAAIKILPDV